MKNNVDPLKISEVTLGKNALADMLYGCFRINNHKSEPFAAEREVELIARSGGKIRIKVPEKMRLDLPPRRGPSEGPRGRSENPGISGSPRDGPDFRVSRSSPAVTAPTQS